MRITNLTISNFKAFESIVLDESFFDDDKFLLVGKNGSGKTTVLEALRFCIAAGNDNSQQSPYLYNALRDKTRPAEFELHLKLDNDEVEICRTHFQALESENSPYWNSEERTRYDSDVTDSIVCIIRIQPPSLPSANGQNRMATLDRSQAYMSSQTIGIDAEGSYIARKLHIIHRIFQQQPDIHRPLIYLNPFRNAVFQETTMFQDYSLASSQYLGSQQSSNDPVKGMNLAQPDFGKNYYQFSYASDLYGGIMGLFYEIARNSRDLKDKMEQRVLRDMKDVNEMIKPKIINGVDLDYSSNALTYTVSAPDGNYNISGLSAGEEQLVIFGLSLPKYLNVSKDIIKPVVIIDEPELHLHPEYCRRLGLFLKDKLPESNQQLFIASHSVEIIQELADCAYQITPTEIKKIEDVLDRTKLFHSLGANFSVADIVNRVVFVEGSDGSSVEIDRLLYQSLASDLFSRKVRFVGAGSKSNVTKVRIHSTDWSTFIQSEIDASHTTDVYAIIDGDVLAWVQETIKSDDKVFVLPAYSVENLLLQPEIINRAYPDKSIALIETALNEIKERLVGQTKEKIVSEYKSHNRRSFEIEGGHSRVEVQEAFKQHMDSYEKSLISLPGEYDKKIIDAGEKWYLNVYGKQLRIELASKLAINAPIQEMYKKLIGVATLDDMPTEMRDWFRDNIL